jgi:serine/threonine-protein kinase
MDEMLGTPQYMAPEQARHTEVDARTDLYALGAIAYRALTGHPPFKGSDIGEILLSVLSDMPLRPTALARLPRDIDLALAIALAKEPSDRFESGAELAEALEMALAGRLPERARKAGRALLAALPWREPR